MPIHSRMLRADGVTSPFINVQPPPISLNRAPSDTADTDVVLGQVVYDVSVTPAQQYVWNGSVWQSGGDVHATTTTYGTVLLTDNSEPVATKVYADALAIAGAPVATETTAGIGQLATDAEAVAGTPSTGLLALFVTPSNLAPVLAAPPAIGGTTPAAGTFTDLTADGTLDLDTTVAGHILVTGAADFSLGSTAGSINISGGEAAADAINIDAASGGLDVDVALLLSLTSSRNNANAIELVASAGGIDISATGTAGEDIDILATGSSVNITATENVADSIVISSTNGGIDITAAGAAAGEDIDITATGSSINLTATENAALAIFLHANGGTSETIQLRADQGTGADSIQLLSDVGGVLVTTGLDAANSIYLHANAGTSETVKIHADQGTGAASINVLSDVGGITLQAGLSTADAINIVASGAAGGIDIDAGTNGVIIDSTGPASIDVSGASNFTVATGDLSLIATLSSVNITANEDAADAVVITSAAGGIDVLATGAAGQDIDIVNTGGSVNITATENVAEAIYIRANGGTSETIRLHADQGTGVASVNIGSDVGGVTISGGLGTADAINLSTSDAAGGVDIDGGTGGIAVDTTGAFSIDGAATSNVTVTGAGADLNLTSVGGSVLVDSTEDAALAIRLHANGGTSETIQIHSDQGTGVSSVGLLSDVGGITLRATGLASADAINLEAVAGGIDMDAALQVNIASSRANAAAIVFSASDAIGGIDITTGGGSIDLSSAGSVTMVAGTDSQAGASCTVNKNVFAATFTGFTTASAGTQTFTIVNSTISTTSQVILTVSNLGANDAQMTCMRVKQLAGSIEIYTKNNGAAALNGNVVITGWVIG